MACYDFQKGACRRGDRCRFSHDLADSKRGGRRGGYREGRGGGAYGESRGGQAARPDRRRGGGTIRREWDEGRRTRRGGDDEYRFSGGSRDAPGSRASGPVESAGSRGVRRRAGGAARGEVGRIRADYGSGHRNSYPDVRGEVSHNYPSFEGRDTGPYVRSPASYEDYRDTGRHIRRDVGYRSTEGEQYRGDVGQNNVSGYRDRVGMVDHSNIIGSRIRDGDYNPRGLTFREGDYLRREGANRAERLDYNGGVDSAERKYRDYRSRVGNSIFEADKLGGRGPYRGSQSLLQEAYEPPSRHGRIADRSFHRGRVDRSPSFDFPSEDRLRGEFNGFSQNIIRPPVQRARSRGDGNDGFRERSRSQRRPQVYGNEVGRQEGTIQRLNEKGFGFIEIGAGETVFFHCNAMTDRGTFDDLREGDPVSFETGLDQKSGRVRAENVLLVR